MKASNVRVDDGFIHQVSNSHDGGKGSIRVDNQEMKYSLSEYMGQELLEIDGGIFIGGAHLLALVTEAC